MVKLNVPDLYLMYLLKISWIYVIEN